jgi:hypothetical protein
MKKEYIFLSVSQSTVVPSNNKTYKVENRELKNNRNKNYL